ncbi:hypothetical protein CDAR_299991 [Caerostris darwini]|uniref:Uncharacterized protein n=1 Tax=Caerostris darwini TaxID=1538125 RepID=A0AAV4W327_9ARAC|nr:hypothetical protein CDAR_299991 [Caerostris darwini]
MEPLTSCVFQLNSYLLTFQNYSSVLCMGRCDGSSQHQLNPNFSGIIEPSVPKPEQNPKVLTSEKCCTRTRSQDSKCAPLSPPNEQAHYPTENGSERSHSSTNLIAAIN